MFRIYSVGYNVNMFKQAMIKSIDSTRYDIIIEPEYTFFPFSDPMSESKRDKHIEDIKTAAQGKGILVAPGSFI